MTKKAEMNMLDMVVTACFTVGVPLTVVSRIPDTTVTQSA